MQFVTWPRVFIIFLSLVSFVAMDFSLTDLTNHPKWALIDYDNCGNSNTERIIGGKNASLGAYPWIARIGYNTDDGDVKDVKIFYKCGGSLINQLYVVTAAHCVTNLPDTYTVSGIRLGEHNTETDPDCENNYCSDPVQDFKPVDIIVHKDYNNPMFRNDIAMIRLDKPVSYNDFVSPICMLTDQLLLKKSFIDETAEVAGWGIYDINDPKSSTILQTLKLPIVDLLKCTKAFRSYAKIGDQQICVGGINGEDSCGGDSGGPLMKVEATDGPPRYYFIGIVSFGAKHCGVSTTPAVYTKISAYLSWILDNLLP